jgi:hypothetical protein
MGMVPFSLTLVLASYLVVTEAVGARAGAVVAALLALLIGLNWWLIPLIRKRAQASATQASDGQRRTGRGVTLPEAGGATRPSRHPMWAIPRGPGPIPKGHDAVHLKLSQKPVQPPEPEERTGQFH